MWMIHISSWGSLRGLTLGLRMVDIINQEHHEPRFKACCRQLSSRPSPDISHAYTIHCSPVVTAHPTPPNTHTKRRHPSPAHLHQQSHYKQAHRLHPLRHAQPTPPRRSQLWFQKGVYIKAVAALETSLVNRFSPTRRNIASEHALQTPTTSLTMSYGSYSSSSPMEIPSRRSAYHNSYLDESCAFPSWPRRVSLGEHGNDQPRATSYISDEDLLFLSEPVFADEDAHSVSSYGSGTPSPRLAPVRHMGGAELEEMRREQALRQQELMRSVMAEKELRRQAARAHKQRKSNSKKASSPRSKLSAMTPIAEAVE